MAVRLQHIINNLEKCCKVWNLKVTLKVLVFRIAGKLSKSDKLYGGDRVEIVNKYQGVIFTTNLSWDLYLKKARSAKFAVNSVWYTVDSQLTRSGSTMLRFSQEKICV